LNSAETNDEMQKIAQEVSPLLTAFSNDVSLNENLFKRVKTIYRNLMSLRLRKILGAVSVFLLGSLFLDTILSGIFIPIYLLVKSIKLFA
jgi:Zn-dependent oligopeptidase